MALLSDESPLSISNMPRKRLYDDNGGSLGFSTNFKLPKIIAAPQLSRYCGPVPGFHETGYLKVRGERTVLPVNPLRMSQQNGSIEPTKLKNVEERLSKVAGNPDLAKEQQHGTLCKQKDCVVSPKTSSQIRPFASKYRPQKIQICDPVPQYSETRVSKVRIQRTGVPVNPLRILTHNDTLKPKEIENVVKGTPKVLRENATLYKRSDGFVCTKTLYQPRPLVSKYSLPKMQSLVHAAHNLPPGVGGRVNCISSSRSAVIPSGKSGVEQMAAVETTRKYGRRFGNELDEDGFASGRKLERIPFKELSKAVPLNAKATNQHKGGNFFPAKESYNLSSFGNQGANSRNRVREILNLFDKIYEDEREAKSKGQGKDGEHISKTATRIVKQKINWVNSDELGTVCGIEIGDQFRFKGQLVLIGLHHQYNHGISYIKIGQTSFATSIVDSDRYSNKIATDPETIFYSGQGGNPLVSRKKVEDQKLERGNLALKNSMDAGTPVRVIRKLQILRESKKEQAFVYAGLYIVTKCTQERGQFGKRIFMFELKRMPGQPKLTDFMASESRKPKGHHGCCVDADISLGKEKIPIRAVNVLDYEKPPRFKYITEMIYPELCKPSMMSSSRFACDCVNGCLDFGGCSCVVKNGGKIPFNENGVLVKVKPTLHECGPSCKCPPSCKNRISQRGMRYQIEIFKTESNRWGVRSQDFIARGSFICEYVGVLRRNKEARKQTNHNEYLYAIGNEPVRSRYLKDTNDDGYAIDAMDCGNVGRFINHSCSPNLYAQKVLYDHDDKRMPHIMLFAAENIPPLREFTLDYNYKIEQVCGVNGKIKKWCS